MSKIDVKITSSRPIFIEADADSFGNIFSHMSDEEQVQVFRAMVEHMRPHQMQWDYISIALEKDENRDVRDALSALFPSLRDLEAQNTKLREAVRPFAAVAKHDISMDEDNQDMFRPMLAHNRAPRLTVGHFRTAFNALGDDNAL